MSTAKPNSKPNYGIDAPDLMRFFFTAGTIALALLLGVLTSVLAGILKIIAVTLAGIATTYFLSMGCFMIYGSKVMKLKDSENLLDLIQWSGQEMVLDVGCGRGLMLIGAAKRLTSGKAMGIDLWQQQDQANNSSAATLANAAIEGVTERIEVETADMRQLPFADGTFDVVVSSWAVHNVEAENDRKKALDEIVRVLKPNGKVVLSDIMNQAEYAQYFEQQSMKDIQLHNNAIRDWVLKAVTFGTFAPAATSARKSAD